MDETKKVTWKHLKKGQKICGTVEGTCYSGFIAYVKETNPAYVTVEKWRKGGSEEKISSEAMFLVEMTDEEIRTKYQRKAEECIVNIQNSLHLDEIGYHEMYNAWLSSDPWELAQNCAQNKLTILGHCSDIIPKTAMFTGEKLDVGICVEDADGDRFWCHYRMRDIDILVERYARFKKWEKDKEGDLEELLLMVPWDLEEKQIREKAKQLQAD